MHKETKIRTTFCSSQQYKDLEKNIRFNKKHFLTCATLSELCSGCQECPLILNKLLENLFVFM
jgi:hypothetical protein